MKSLLRRNLLMLMLGATAAAFTINIQTPAFAKNGSDDGSSSSSSSSGSSGSGSSSSSGSSDDSSGSGGGDDDNSGSGSSGDDNSGSGSSHDSSDDNSSGDDSNNRSASNDDRRNGGGGGGNRANRPRVQISVDGATRAGLLNGTLVAVDNLGRPLEVEVEDGGVLIAKPHGGDAKRKPGPITSFNVVPAAQAPVHQ